MSKRKYGRISGKREKITLVLGERHAEIIRGMAEAEGITIAEKLRRVLEPWLKQIEGYQALKERQKRLVEVGLPAPAPLPRPAPIQR